MCFICLFQILDYQVTRYYFTLFIVIKIENGLYVEYFTSKYTWNVLKPKWYLKSYTVFSPTKHVSIFKQLKILYLMWSLNDYC